MQKPGHGNSFQAIIMPPEDRGAAANCTRFRQICRAWSGLKPKIVSKELATTRQRPDMQSEQPSAGP
jgi:hypothetical protein